MKNLTEAVLENCGDLRRANERLRCIVDHLIGGRPCSPSQQKDAAGTGLLERLVEQAAAVNELHADLGVLENAIGLITPPPPGVGQSISGVGGLLRR